jgi:hypothetical protein
LELRSAIAVAGAFALSQGGAALGDAALGASAVAALSEAQIGRTSLLPLHCRYRHRLGERKARQDQQQA